MKKVAVVVLLIVAVLIMAGFPLQVNAGVIYGCYGERDGGLRIVTDPSKCRPNESSTWWNQEGAPGIGAIKVFDANDQFLGMLIDLEEGSGHMRIYIPSLRLATLIDANTGDIDTPSPNSQQFYFASNDCTGQPYVAAVYSFIFIKGGGIYEGDWFIGEHIAPVSVQINSCYGTGPVGDWVCMGPPLFFLLRV